MPTVPRNINRPSRRELLKKTAAAIGTAAYPNHRAIAAKPAPPGDSVPYLRVLLREADHSPLDSVRMHQLDARDLHGDPLPQKIISAPGRVRIALAGEPVQVMTRMKVPGFGEINCFVDGGGRGYSKPATIDFVVEAALTRRRRVREAIERWSKEGVTVSDEIRSHMTAADRPFEQMPEGPQRTVAAYESLAHSLHAGEKLALARARHRISKLASPRKGFLFGCPCWHPGQNRAIDQAALELFNFATVSWYSWKDPTPPSARIDYTRMDVSVDWCLANKIEPKIFGYTYMTRGATPAWIQPDPALAKAATGNVFNKDWPFERLLDLYTSTQFNTLSRYRDKAKYVEVINEAHDKSNLWRLNHGQILEMTVESLKAARRGSPTVKRLINHCCLWAEYAKNRNSDGSRRWSPYTYLKDVVKAGGEFEIVGLQLYYPRFDLFEIDRMLDRFADLGKPCHITEIACNSTEGLDPQSMRPKDLVPGWHGPWNETMQADWAEAIYTMVYSKPHFEGIGWWDLADTPGHFWPHGALLHADGTPKESYHRIARLQKEWGVSKKDV
jgi:GH35 family endo-1,4-beta-xylanase